MNGDYIIIAANKAITKKIPEDSLLLQVLGGVNGSSKPIIAQIENPIDSYFNVNRLNVKPEIKKRLSINLIMRTNIVKTNGAAKNTVGNANISRNPKRPIFLLFTG